jgi:hypothetical protein
MIWRVIKMGIKQIAQSIFFVSFKLLWAVLCYIIAIGLAIVSGYFTIVFYTDGTTGNDMYTMSGLAIAVEVIKLMFSTGYPYLKYRHKKSENKVLLIMRVTLILSILASLYYLLLGNDFSLSPASRTIAMLYDHVGILRIIPLGFSQFIGTISLSVLTEYFIVFLPQIAPIMFWEKDFSRKTYAVTNFDKLKEVIVAIPDMYINKIYLKAMEYIQREQEKIKEIQKASNVILIKELEKPKPIQIGINKKSQFKLLKGTSDSKDNDNKNSDLYRDEENSKNKNTEINTYSAEPYLLNRVESDNAQPIIFTEYSEDEKSDLPLQKRAGDEIINDGYNAFSRAIYKISEDNICPSVKQIIEYTGLSRNRIYEIKKDFEKLGILKTDGFETIILTKYKEALKRIKSRISE